MIKSKDFITSFKSFHLEPYLMVPCSIFKPLNAWVMKSKTELIFPPNEAHAMGFAAGSFLATGKPAVIFLQNSGLNNIANAQTSLHALYKIPVLLVVSWRGEKKDAPEHEIMGKNLPKFFDTLQIPFTILTDNWNKELRKMVDLAKKEKRPVAIVVREGIFEKESFPTPDLTEKYPLARIDAIKILKGTLKKKAVFISTNGFTSRDSFAVSQSPDFYMMGSMGHAFSIGAGVVHGLTGDKKIVVLDGDGGSLMHLGSLALIGLSNIKNSNLIYVLLDNEAYESTGSQPTLSSQIDFVKIAKGFGFPQIFSVKKSSQLKNVIKKLKPNKASFIHIKINRKKTEETARVSDKYTCEEIAKRFRSNFT